MASANKGPGTQGPESNYPPRKRGSELDRLRAENERLQAWEKAANEGHPRPCTLGPLCPYCEIDRQRAAIERKDAALREAREALAFYGAEWEQDCDAAKIGPDVWEGSIGPIEPTVGLTDDAGAKARAALNRIEKALGNVREDERYCICADPENCTEAVPGYICRRGNVREV